MKWLDRGWLAIWVGRLAGKNASSAIVSRRRLTENNDYLRPFSQRERHGADTYDLSVSNVLLKNKYASNYFWRKCICYNAFLFFYNL